MQISAQWENYAQIEAKLDFESLVGPPVVGMLQAAGNAIKADAAANAPNDLGGLKGGFFARVERVDRTTWEAPVGNTVSYSAFMEYGTGTQHDNPQWGPRPVHKPPAKYLDAWAERHGFPSGRVVSRIIARRGGLKPRRFLRNAFAAEEMRLPSRAGALAREIVARWEA